jgi:1-acyl-sn-glycerol-3-phosphate acyltransferase
MKKNGFRLFVWRVLRVLAAPLLRKVFHYEYGRSQGEGPLLVISNHTTDLDPFFVGSSFSGPLYYASDENVFCTGLVSKFLGAFFKPLELAGGTKKTEALLDCLRAGNNVCLFAEGARSFSGLTGKIADSTGEFVCLAAETGAGLVIYRIHGGYFASPRWARKKRKGSIRGEPAACYSPAILKTMKAEEITAAIRKNIYEDAYETMKRHPEAYKSKIRAENLETCLYLCPSCGQIGKLHSKKDVFYCDCGFSARYDEYGALHGSSPNDRPVQEDVVFTSVRDWWFWQSEAMESLARNKDPVCSDEDEILYEAKNRGLVRLTQGKLSIGRDGLHCGSFSFPLNEISALTISGQQTLVLDAGGKRYELRNSTLRSAAKYLRSFEILTSSRDK